MRAKSREINIFSVSALDLFASALGAFIIVTIVLLAYFPNTGDSPERTAEVRKLLNAEKELRKEAEAEKEKLQKELDAKAKELGAKARENDRLKQAIKSAKDALVKAKFPDVDLVIALDTTGSMRKEVKGLSNSIGDLVKVLDKLAPSVAVGVVEFKDRCYAIPTRSFRLQAVSKGSGSFRNLQSFLNSMSVGGEKCNTDGPEAVDQALERAIAMPWRSASGRRVIAVVTDNPAYPSRVSATFDMARRFASRGRGNAVSGISTGSGLGSSYLRKLAAAGKGSFVEGGGFMIATLLLALLEKK